jgi:hypothetical protein
MDRVLVVLVGGFEANTMVRAGEGVKLWKPSSWQRLPAGILPEEFARSEQR